MMVMIAMITKNIMMMIMFIMSLKAMSVMSAMIRERKMMVMIMLSTSRRLDLSRTAGSLDPTDGQSFAALGCTGNYDK